MFIYANGFHVSVKDDQSEVLIRFVQNSPAYGDASGSSTSTGVEQEIVSSIVVSGDLAKGLVSTIQELFEKHNGEN